MKISFTDTTLIDNSCAEVDMLCDAARLKVVGDPVRVKEYEIAKQQAIDFKTAGYQGDVPQYVLSWQEAKAADSWTAQMACDDILAAAARWEYALGELRDMRLKVKESIKRCTKKADIDAIIDKFKSDLAAAMAGVE